MSEPSPASVARSARILYAEDDPASVVRVRGVLQPEGYQVDPVGTGRDFVESCTANPPDLALLDLTLPDGSGLDFLNAVHKSLPDLPIIIITASESVRDAVAAIKYGAQDFLTKPIDAQRLSVSVRNGLQLSQQKEEIERLKIATGEGSSKVAIDDVLRDLILRGGSDLHLKAGRPPLMRISSDLAPSEFPVLSESDVNAIIRAVLGRDGTRILHEEYEYDASYELPGVARFRVNAFKRMGQFGAAFRAIPLNIPTIDLMGLPPVLKDICKVPQGMVLVTGPTGSGKSTSLAAMIDHLNQSQPLHIVTIEDPIEFVYTDQKSTVTQRQLGSDVKSLQEALRRALRQDPDVILMGEMRDRETMELAMHAAETGHLVFSTLHTNDAKQTLDRIVDAFPADAAHQVRSMMALTLQAVISQRLVRRADGKGRIAAVEVMINSPNIRELIAEGKTTQIEKAIAQSGDYYKMQTFNQALARLIQSRTITEEEGLGASTSSSDLKLILKGITGGSSTTMRAVTLPTAPGSAPAPATPAASPPPPRINRGF
ncbi:MAG TPA: PilT/PilU family type 4a pilus ATPase [Planctomycetota bacterium]|nr:PilT/PilU family type 4a pilus ATPase [Planctomycetota bacterium]